MIQIIVFNSTYKNNNKKGKIIFRKNGEIEGGDEREGNNSTCATRHTNTIFLSCCICFKPN